MNTASGTPIKLVLELVAAFSIVLSLVWQIRVDAQQNEWDRKNETLHMLEERDRSFMREVNSSLKGIKASDSVLQAILSDKEIRSQVVKQLNQFEHISIGCNIGIYDLSVVDRFIGTSFRKFFNRMKPYIDHQRKKTNNPKLYLDYEQCVTSMPVEEDQDGDE